MSNYRLKGASGPVINQAFSLAANNVIGRAGALLYRVVSIAGPSWMKNKREDRASAVLARNLVLTGRGVGVVLVVDLKGPRRIS